MKVALISYSYPNVSYDGVAFSVFNLANALSNYVDVTLFVPDINKDRLQKLEQRARLYLTEMVNIPFLRSPTFMLQVSRKLRPLDFDIIHSNGGVALFCRFVSVETFRHRPRSFREKLYAFPQYLTLRRARQYENSQVWNLETQRLPFDGEYFDAVLAKDILEHLQAPWVLVTEIYRTLRPGGIVISNVPMAKPKVVWNDYTHIRGFTRKALRMLFEDCGFDVIHIHKMGGVPLTGKLRLTKWIHILLWFPPFDLLFGRCLEIKARRPAEGGEE